MIHALVTGALFRAPEQRQSKAGRPFASATVRVKDGEGSQFIRVMIFSESAMAELLRLGDGDSVSVSGSLKVETYEKNGETNVSFTVMADAVLALRPAPKQSKPKAEPARDPDPRSKTERQRGSWSRESGDFSDQIPF